MKQSILLIILMTGAQVLAAPRMALRQAKPAEQKIVYVPIASYNPNQVISQEEEDNRVLASNIAAIAGNFGSIIIAPHNTPLVFGSLGNIMQGIVNIAGQLFKGPHKEDLKRRMRDPEFLSLLVMVLRAQSEIIRSGQCIKLV